MKYVKVLIVASFSLLLLLLALMFFAPRPEEQLNQVLNDYLKGDIKGAEEKLTPLANTLSPMHYDLYQAYLARANNNLEKSTKDLISAEKDAIKGANFPLITEIYLNEALNAYLTGENNALALAVKGAEKFGGPNLDWVLLFRGILAYNQGKYDQALTQWKSVGSRVPLSPWMNLAFSTIFTDYWFLIKTAYSNIEDGNITAARQSLEGAVSRLSGEQLEDVFFLIGLSYAKEAEIQGPVEAIPYYQEALSYFKKVPFQSERYENKRKLLIDRADFQMENLLQGSDYKNLPFYLTMFQALHAEARLEKVKISLMDQFQRALVLGSLNEVQDIYNVLLVIVPEKDLPSPLKVALEERKSKETLETLDQEVRTGQLFSTFTDPVLESQPVKSDGNLKEKVQAADVLLKKALKDHFINSQFNVEHSTDLRKAHRLLNNVVEHNKNTIEIYIMLGQVRYLLGDFAGAVEAYESALRLNPRNPEIYAYQALVYEAVNQSEDAILVLLQGLQYSPKNAEIWEQLADLYLVTGNEIDALPSYREAMRLDPENPELYLALGRLQVDLEVPEDARENLKKYLVWYPDSHEGLKLLLSSLYNPLLNIQMSDIETLDKERADIYERLYKIDPAGAEKIRNSYQAPPTVATPPPQPEPDLPFLPQ